MLLSSKFFLGDDTIRRILEVAMILFANYARGYDTIRKTSRLRRLPLLRNLCFAHSGDGGFTVHVCFVKTYGSVLRSGDGTLISFSYDPAENISHLLPKDSTDGFSSLFRNKSTGAKCLRK